MFIDNVVVKKFEGEERYDRFAIAGTLFDVSFKGANFYAKIGIFALMFIL